MTTFIYARISTNDKGQTIENQTHAITEQYTASIVISDEGVSGTKHPMKREGFARLMKLAKTGDTIIITAFDRLSRNTQDFLGMLDALKQLNITLISLRERIDTATSQGYLMATQFIAFAQYERDLISERTKASLKRLSDKGVQLGAKVTEKGVEARRMLSEGYSVADIVAATGITKAMVYRLKKQAL